MIAVYVPHRCFPRSFQSRAMPRVSLLFPPLSSLPARWRSLPYPLPPSFLPCLPVHRHFSRVIAVTAASHKDTLPLRGTIKRRAIDRYSQARHMTSLNAFLRVIGGRVRFFSSPFYSSFYYQPEEDRRGSYLHDFKQRYPIVLRDGAVGNRRTELSEIFLTRFVLRELMLEQRVKRGSGICVSIIPGQKVITRH